MSAQKEGTEHHVIQYFQLYPHGWGLGNACGFVSQETLVFSEPQDFCVFYKWKETGIKACFAFSISMSISLYVSIALGKPETPACITTMEL